MSDLAETIGHLTFGKEGNADSCLGAGWSAGEDGFRWMIDDLSEFWFDTLGAGSCVLSLDLRPLVGMPYRPMQRVIIQIGEVEIYRAELSAPVAFSIPIPSSALGACDRLHFTIHHPDAVRPIDFADIGDHRRLALSIREARLQRVRSTVAERETKPSESPAAPVVITEPTRLSTVFVGNCQMDALSRLYHRVLPAGSDHIVTYIASYNDATPSAMQAVADATAVVQQVLISASRIGELPTHGKVYLVPHVSAAFLWPYAGTPHPLNRPEPVLEPSGPYNAELGDGFLNRKIAAGVAPNIAIADYLTAEASIIKRAERMMELHLQKQRDRDEACGIPIAARISEHLSTRQFRSRNHPEPSMSTWIAGEVFTRMGEDPAAIARLIASQPDVFPPTETPIHPAVARHFGLFSALPERQYRFFEEGSFTFIEYADRYMRYDWNALLAEALYVMRQQRTDSALAKLKLALSTAPRSTIARLAFAEASAQLGQLEDAIDYAYQAIKIEPDGVLVKRLVQLSDQWKLRRSASVRA
ncbi:WcbI family polysaccharide biosynthesis putative acetyltransferase [Rhodopila sp.]|uniref:WcbI family polysaccharide biosynthesis putative acetyltransferase n=1 Tax=Rhodopila sp. TaxID=2480087 RepID=UPI003D0BEE6F